MEAELMAKRIQLRRDTAAAWALAAPVLAQGEEGLELDTNRRKVGDGITAWNNLPYTNIALNMTGEMRDYSGANVPDGWMAYLGQLLNVADYPALFAVIGAVFGGDGITTFALPNRRQTGYGHRIINVGRPAPYPVVSMPVPAVIHGPTPDSFLPGDVLSFTVQLLDPVSVAGGSPKLSVTIGSSIYLLTRMEGATATEWHYEHTMSSADSGALSAEIDLNGAVLTTGAVPVTLSVTYLSNNRSLSADYLGATMAPDAESKRITQAHALVSADATMTPGADTGVIV
jgi:hypothetical protein